MSVVQRSTKAEAPNSAPGYHPARFAPPDAVVTRPQREHCLQSGSPRRPRNGR